LALSLFRHQRFIFVVVIGVVVAYTGENLNMTNLLMQGVGMTSLRTRERLIQRLREQGVTNMRVLDVLLNTPRHIFLDEALAHRAYEDTALPIGHGQTISQPYIVARMTEVLLGAAGGKLNKVLEVGTGSGYQTSVLAQLVPNVYSVERIKPLQDKARERLRQLGLRNVQFRHADGGFGWPEAGPYDGILSTAAPQAVPDELLKQLAPGGVLVIPVGGREQQLHLILRDGEGENYVTQILEPVKFVPFLSGTSR
jgi:protein-L-isoaspartate(D-aspartate) O-methyltransferase